MKPDRQASLQVWIDWLLSLHQQEIDLGLDRISAVANKLSLLEPDYRLITVAGTNGKGSSVAMLSAVYRQAGYRVGAYTSPHLLHFNERIQINGQPVSDQKIIDAFCKIESVRGQIKLTYFEFSTLAALIIFTDTPLDVVVLEVGLGGRLDAVNILDADVALVTAIGLDHADWLGTDIQQIAKEKAGIMRKGHAAVCSDKQVPESLIDYAATHQVPLSLLGRDFDFERNHQAWSFLEVGVNPRQFALPALQGKFQLNNAAGVVKVVDVLRKVLPVNDDQVSRGFKTVSHAGRLEKLVAGKQQWLIDVAHNPQAAEVLSDYLSETDFNGHAIFSVLSDKDYGPMIKMVLPFISDWYLADLQVPRAETTEKLYQQLVNQGVQVERIHVCQSIVEAVQTAAKMDQKYWLVWGSFFTVAQAKRAPWLANQSTEMK